MAPPHREKEQFLHKLTGIIESNLENEQFGVSELARAIGMSRSNLHRKIKSVSGKSVSRFIQEVRLSKAHELLKDSDLTVSEVAYRVGFGSATYFTKCFHDHFGYPPGEALKISLKEGQSDPFLNDRQIQAPIRTRLTNPWFILGTIGLLSMILYLWIAKPFSQHEPSREMVIMVLPFYNDNPGEGDNYIINGLMDEILNKLALLKDMSVISRNTSEIYRDSPKSTRDIAMEVGARYILEGSAQTAGSTTRIRLQLIDALNDSHLWVKPFERKITLENLFEVQEEVAVAIAEELIGVLKPQVKEEIEKKPTENLAAYNAFLQASDILHLEVQPRDLYISVTDQAKQLLLNAIKLDRQFAEAYAWMGHLYINRYYFIDQGSEEENVRAVMETGEQYIDTALTLDPNLQEALMFKGVCLYRKGETEEADRYFQISMRNRARNYEYYRDLSSWYLGNSDYYQGLINYEKFDHMKPADYPVPVYLKGWAFTGYVHFGIVEKARPLAGDLLAVNWDSSTCFRYMEDMEFRHGNYAEAIRYRMYFYTRDTTDTWAAANIGRYYFYLRDDEQGIRWMMPWIEDFEKNEEDLGPSCLAGYAYQKMGIREKAEYELKRDLSRLLQDLDKQTEEVRSGYIYLHIARVYSMLGNREKTLEYIEQLADFNSVEIRWINELKNWPSFDLVRDTPEFKKKLDKLENNFRKEREPITRLLENN
jgi:TolB-like protein/AraC-like DNA-binding protein